MAASLSALAARLVDVPPPPPPDPARCGVYLLLTGDEVVYIGQSTRVDLRLSQYRYEKRIRFDRALMVCVPVEDLDAYEGALIRAFLPPCNAGAPKPTSRELAILIDLGLPMHSVVAARREINRRHKRPEFVIRNGRAVRYPRKRPARARSST